MNPVLKVIADNPALFDALKAHLESQFEPETKRADDTITDLQLGQMYRARLVGLQKLEQAFKEIATLKTHVDNPITRNPAR